MFYLLYWAHICRQYFWNHYKGYVTATDLRHSRLLIDKDDHEPKITEMIATFENIEAPKLGPQPTARSETSTPNVTVEAPKRYSGG